MSREATAATPDDNQDIAEKYKILKEKLAVLVDQMEKPSNAIDQTTQERVGASNALQTEAAAVLADELANSSEKQEHEVEHCYPRTIDDIKELEKFRLGVWIAKTVVIMMVAIVIFIMILFIYAVYTTKTLPDISLLGTIIGHLKDVIVIIIDTEN